MRQIRFMGKEKGIEVFSALEDSIYNKLAAKTLNLEKLSVEDISNLIDIAAKLDTEQKQLWELVKRAKELLLLYGKKHKITTIDGNIATVKISPKTNTCIKVLGFIRLVKKLGKSNILKDTLNVSVTEAKKYIPQDDLENISDIKTEKYGTVSIKKKINFI